MIIGPVSYSPGLVDEVITVNPDEFMQGESLYTHFPNDTQKNRLVIFQARLWCVRASLGEGHGIEDIRRSTAWWRKNPSVYS